MFTGTHTHTHMHTHTHEHTHTHSHTYTHTHTNTPLSFEHLPVATPRRQNLPTMHWASEREKATPMHNAPATSRSRGRLLGSPPPIPH